MDCYKNTEEFLDLTEDQENGLLLHLQEKYNSIAKNVINVLEEIEESETHLAFISRKIITQLFWNFIEMKLHENFLVNRLEKGIHYDNGFKDNNGRSWYYKVRLLYKTDLRRRRATKKEQ